MGYTLRGCVIMFYYSKVECKGGVVPLRLLPISSTPTSSTPISSISLSSTYIFCLNNQFDTKCQLFS